MIPMRVNVKNPSRFTGKLSAYECGLEPVGDARMKFEILFYLISFPWPTRI